MKYVKLAGHGICNHASHQSNEIRTLCRLATGSGFLFLSTTSNNRFRTFDSNALLRYDGTITRRRAFFMRYKIKINDDEQQLIVKALYDWRNELPMDSLLRPDLERLILKIIDTPDASFWRRVLE